jgi:hypothetical protein
MMLCQRLYRFAPVLTLVSLAVLFLPGCVPVTWLPDSSGFVYVHRVKAKNPDDPWMGRLVHFDLKKNAPRIVVNDIGPDTFWPAVSPDGKRIATARFKGEPNGPKTVQIVVWDFDGKQIQQSKGFPWSPKVEENQAITQKGKGAMLFLVAQKRHAGAGRFRCCRAVDGLLQPAYRHHEGDRQSHTAHSRRLADSA